MSCTQLIIALVVGASASVLICFLILVVMVRLRRAVKSQLETIDNLLSALHADRDNDTPRRPS